MLEISIPSSKSVSNRLLIINQLSNENIKIENLSTAKDTQTLAYLLKNIKHLNVLDVGPAGTTIRFLTALCALKYPNKTLTGTDRMKQRPIGVLVDALKALGTNISFIEKDGFPPLVINNTIKKGGTITISGDVSSQYITGLMLIAPALKGGLIIKIKNELVSVPYLKMTQKIMSYFGAKVSFTEQQITIEEGSYTRKPFVVEPDWSSASYWYEITALSTKSVFLKGYTQNSLQGDKVVSDVFLNYFGVVSDFKETGVLLTKNKDFQPKDFELNCEDFPDLAQTLAVTAAGVGVNCKLTGLKTLRIKETDRIDALEKELQKFNVKTLTTKDTLTILKSEMKLTTSVVDTYHDHRMAMAFAPLKLIVGDFIIKDPTVVEKSYPTFWNDFKKIK